MLSDRERRAVTVRGAVQGVGFRPFVHGLARRLGLRGFVKNRAGDVFIEVEGEPLALEQFLNELTQKPPPLARIDDVHIAVKPREAELCFRIERSDTEMADNVVLPPDVATCDACLRELFDPCDRRYRYPFLNCTHCGPRLTIVTGAPYDRERTVMAPFVLCASCRAERDDPNDRRFHAQPVACPSCGPRIAILDGDGAPVPCADPISFCIAELVRGSIVAMKGLGGYHLACDAENEGAVVALRRRKEREDKPFAVMVASMTVAESLCEIAVGERALLESPASPIVLLRRGREPRRDAPRIASAVAPDEPMGLGLMLPYTPIHHLIFREGGFRALVMTSGNRTDEPIAYLDRDAPKQLHGVADLFLTHNRPIEVRCDDSVVRGIAPRAAGGTMGVVPLRRSRGYAPSSLRLTRAIDRPTLAVGGDLKSTFALAAGDRAVLSHHIGDLEHYAAYRAFETAVAHYERLYGIAPRRLVHDLHPDYASTRYALERATRHPGLELLAVQHHHAHMASCMVEHGLTGPVLGVCFDGAGLGIDGTIWGGEFLLGGYREVTRVAHLRPVRMPGGDLAAREPWRMALSHLVSAHEDPSRSAVSDRIDARRRKAALAMVEKPFNAPMTSSIGRLFDAVASLAGVCDQVSFEGQAAMRLEALATGVTAGAGYEFDHDAECRELDPSPVIRAVVADAGSGTAPSTMARKFHTAVVNVVVRTCAAIRHRVGIDVVVLSGGVFSNAILTAEIAERLEDDRFRVHRHHATPPNDGGLSLGQVAIAAATERAA